MDTNVRKLRGVTLPAGPAYRNISEFIAVNPFFDLPVSAGLVGAYFLSSQMSNPLNNHANLGLPLLKIGNPTVGSTFTSFSDGNQYDTQLPVGTSAGTSSAVTIIAVTKNPSTTVDCWPFGNYLGGSGAISTENLQVKKDNKMEVFVSNGTNLVSTVTDITASGTSGQLRVIAGRYGPTSVTGSCFRPSTDDMLHGTAAVSSRKTPATTNYRIGGRPGMTGNGTPDVSAVLIYEGRLSDAEVLTVCRYLRGTFGTRYGLW